MTKAFIILPVWFLTVRNSGAVALRSALPENACTGDFGTEVSRARYYNPQVGRFWTMDTFEGSQEDPLSLHKYVYSDNNPVNRIDPSGLESYVGFETVGWNDFGHVGIITHNQATGIFTRFDHAHGVVAEKKGTDQWMLFQTYGVVFIIDDKYDAALDAARQNYKKHPGGSTMSNNCLTSVLEIFEAAQVPYPSNGKPLYPNMWLKAFWDANYEYILVKPKAGKWMMDRLVRKSGLHINNVPGTGAVYVTIGY